MSGGLGKMLIQLGIVLIIAGVVIHFGSKIFPFGSLPGDIHMEGKHGSFYFPCLLFGFSFSILLIINLFSENELMVFSPSSMFIAFG